ncbi:hypothetical protein NDU88_007235 [Pleurodeles waltl]|uniref:Uncharacterized protein n=1 Tax=Pleurodeles waltl TaxID=8319 RepID=A0AAV7QR09_PLEWA|nr:hypothetical protein NDU88_007235 [Pleurodeles waltl]
MRSTHPSSDLVSDPCAVRSWCRGGFLSSAQGLQTERCGPVRSSVPKFSSAKNYAGDGWETACGGQQAEARDIHAELMPRFGSGRVIIAADTSDEGGGEDPLLSANFRRSCSRQDRPGLRCGAPAPFTARPGGWGRRGSRAPPPVAGGPKGPIQRSDPPAPPVSRGCEIAGRRGPHPHLPPILFAGSRFIGRLFYATESRDRDSAASVTISSDSAAPLFQGHPGGRCHSLRAYTGGCLLQQLRPVGISRQILDAAPPLG